MTEAMPSYKKRYYFLIPPGLFSGPLIMYCRENRTFSR